MILNDYKIKLSSDYYSIIINLLIYKINNNIFFLSFIDMINRFNISSSL